MADLALHVFNGPGDLVFDLDRLQGAGLRITTSHRAEDLPHALGDAEILLTNAKHDIAALRAHAPHLRWVQTASAGVEAMLPGLPRDVVLTNASGVHAEKGAEFVLTAALMLNYRMPQFAQRQARREWAPEFARPLRGKRALVLGTGSIGAAAIALLAGRGMEVVAVNRSGQPVAAASRTVRVDALDDVLPQADLLVSTLPATPGTRGLIDAARLRAMPPGAGVVSVGRAAVFDHAALCAQLRSGHLGGAVLDVFPVEPLPADDPTWDVPNMVITPHCSVDDLDGYTDRCLAIFLRNLELYRQGLRMETQVDPAQGY